ADGSEVRGLPEMRNGRVKTVPPAVHGGVRAIRNNAAHAEAMRLHRIQPIDLVVVNLYPFERTAARGADFDDCIENIDIGGPAMIRAAAKNHTDVAGILQPPPFLGPPPPVGQHGGRNTPAPRPPPSAPTVLRPPPAEAPG